jgi:hypothetical protein
MHDWPVKNSSRNTLDRSRSLYGIAAVVAEPASSVGLLELTITYVGIVEVMALSEGDRPGCQRTITTVAWPCPQSRYYYIWARIGEEMRDLEGVRYALCGCVL